MSRSGYSDDNDYDQWASIRWAGQLASAMRGKRGQAFFAALVEALDALPEKRLIADELEVRPAPNDVVTWLFADSLRPELPEYMRYDWRHDLPAGREVDGALKLFAAPSQCGVCALGAVGLKRGVAMGALDPENAEAVSEAFDIAEALARQVVYENDEGGRVWSPEYRTSRAETPEERWQRMRAWAVSHVKEPA